jgi:hypothetical protein
MATTGARSVHETPGTGHDHNHSTGTDVAKLFCRVVGPVLILVGLLGFIADATFDTGLSGADDDGGNNGGALQGDSFLGFEVNGWHNIVHILSGAFLLLGARGKEAVSRGADAVRDHADTARKVALTFGVVYLLVTIIGMIDGNDVLGLLPVNPADNILHLVLSLSAIAAALISKKHAERHANAAGRR